MDKIWVVVLIWVIIPTTFLVEASLHVKGTTTPPNFKRRSGKLSIRCPSSHPYALNHGENCCLNKHNILNNSSLIQHEDPVTVCEVAELITCPALDHVCRGPGMGYEPEPPSVEATVGTTEGTTTPTITTTTEMITKGSFEGTTDPATATGNTKGTLDGMCPSHHPHPIGNGNVCCGSSRYRDNTLCSWGSLQMDDPPHCCLEGDFILCPGGGQCQSKPYTETLLIRQTLGIANDLFTSPEHLYVNQNDVHAPKFSRMGDIETFRQNGKFHMKLCYPMDTSTVEVEPCYEFKQNQDPLLITDIQADIGLEILTIPYYPETPARFNGLRNVHSTETFLTATDSSSPWLSIMSKTYCSSCGGGIPGQGTAQDVAELYIITNP